MANLQEKENQETILQTIINLSEKLQDCKLEDSAIAEEKAQINRLASYLNVDEISAILFINMWSFSKYSWERWLTEPLTPWYELVSQQE